MLLSKFQIKCDSEDAIQVESLLNEFKIAFDKKYVSSTNAIFTISFISVNKTDIHLNGLLLQMTSEPFLSFAREIGQQTKILKYLVITGDNCTDENYTRRMLIHPIFSQLLSDYKIHFDIEIVPASGE